MENTETQNAPAEAVVATEKVKCIIAKVEAIIDPVTKKITYVAIDQNGFDQASQISETTLKRASDPENRDWSNNGQNIKPVVFFHGKNPAKLWRRGESVEVAEAFYDPTKKVSKGTVIARKNGPPIMSNPATSSAPEVTAEVIETSPSATIEAHTETKAEVKSNGKRNGK